MLPSRSAGMADQDQRNTHAERAAFIETYSGTVSGQRLRRGLARTLTDDPAAMAFFDNLISSGDEK